MNNILFLIKTYFNPPFESCCFYNIKWDFKKYIEDNLDIKIVHFTHVSGGFSGDQGIFYISFIMDDIAYSTTYETGKHWENMRLNSRDVLFSFTWDFYLKKYKKNDYIQSSYENGYMDTEKYFMFNS